MDGDSDSKPNTQDAVDSIVLEEEIDPNYVPSEPEVVEYAKWMGMDLDKDQDLFWIAREGLMAPLPKDWKPCRTKDTEDIYYFNFSTGDSTWDHPCDGYYKRLYEEEKKKKETVIKESGDQNRSKAKQDVEQLLGKSDKKKAKKVVRTLSDIDMVKALPAPLGLQKAPLPGINNPLRMSAPSNLGPLSSGGAGFGDALGSIGKKNSLSRGSEMDAKVASSLDGPRLVSSRDPSPLGRAPLDSAETKGVSLTSRQRIEQKDREEEMRGSESEVDKSLGGLDVTSSLSSKSRMLGGSSSATSKLRASLPGSAAADFGSERRQAPSEEKLVDDGRADSKEPGEKADETTAAAAERSAGRHEKTSSALSELERYKSKCAELERRAEENEARVADYKASYTAAKEDLLALERRYESNQSQWLDRVRALEVEKDKVESERRQLKLALLDLESAAKPAAQVSAASDRGAEEEVRMANSRLQDQVRALEMEKDKVESERRQLKLALLDLESAAKPAAQVSAEEEGVRAENGRLRQEVADLKVRLQFVEEAQAQSVIAFSELQARADKANKDAQLRVAELESQNSTALATTLDLATQLEGCKRELLEARSIAAAPAPSVDSAGTAELQRALLEQRELNSRCEADLLHLRTSLANEQVRSSDALKATSEQQRAFDERLLMEASSAAALQQQLTSALTALASARTELERQTVSNDSSVNNLVSRTETAEANLRAAEVTISTLRSAEASTKIALAEKDRKLSDQQEQILALQASNNLSTNSDSEKNAQFEVFVSQATAIRKSLKSEIERQKAQILELESEKASLVTQLTRQETTLQFAKKELNGVASLAESNRQLDVEKQQLVAQLEITRASSTRQAEQEFQLRERYEQVLQARHEEGELLRALKEESARLTLTLEQERTFGTQSEKKIKSYQEELLQLQRRLAERASPPATFHGATIEETSNLSSSPPLFVDASAAEVLELRSRVGAMQTEQQRLEQELALSVSALHASKEQVLQSRRSIEILTEKVSELQQQLRVAALKMSDAGADQSNLYKASMEERDRLEMEKISLESQLQILRAQISTSQANLEFSNINVQRLEGEVRKYREKWMASEQELTDARVALETDTAGDKAVLGALRAERRDSQAAAQLSTATEDSLRSQVGALRKALDDQNAVVKELRLDALRATTMPSENKENALQSGGGNYADRDLGATHQVPANQHSLSQQHIVALSLEVGRQQATMERLEQHIRNTEVVLHEIKSQSRVPAPAPASPVVRQSRAGAAAPAEDAARDSSTPESQQSLLVVGGSGRGGDGFGSSSPARRNRNKQLQQPRTVKSVQFVSSGRDKDRRQAVDARPAAELLDLIDIKDKVAALIEEMDMDVHDCTTLTGLQVSRGQETPPLHLVGPTAQRVLIEGKTRLRKEAKFLKEVQVVCLAAKDAISHNQECVKNLKAAWRSAKSDSRGGSTSSSLTTESVNSITLKVNGAVDELRDTQQLTKNRENRSKSLHQSVQYLEQLVAGQGGEEAQHWIEIMRLVQEQCLESAAELEALLRTYRNKGRLATRGGDRTEENAKNAVMGVAFSATTQHRSEPAMDAHSTRIFGTPGAQPVSNPFETYSHQPMQLSYPPSPSRSRLAYSSAPSFGYSTGATNMTIPSSASVSVSGMRNSDLKNRLLQEQIAKITERQSLSKAVCEKHAGWLSDLGKEISGAVHGGPSTTSSSAVASSASFSTSAAALGRSRPASSEPFAASLQAYKEKYASNQDQEQLSAAQSRSFGTALHNQQQAQAREDAVGALLQDL